MAGGEAAFCGDFASLSVRPQDAVTEEADWRHDRREFATSVLAPGIACRGATGPEKLGQSVVGALLPS
jgi:hypothetical protein